MGTRALQAEKLIREHMVVAMGAGLVPLPFADFATATLVQLSLVRKLAELYGVSFSGGVARGLITALVGGVAVRGGASLTKFIPGVGWMLGGLAASVLAAASTYAVGKVFQAHFAQGGTLSDFSPAAARKAYEAAFREGKGLAQQASAADPYDRLRKLHDLYKAGVLSEEEYQHQKAKLLSEL
uniref:Hypothetical conserved protein n=1 Tax=uncultured Bacteroidota bacterium TaxID=152509 RepID=H5SGI2_9BACT|nr:hypothetical conserved protein [uncultured Bacteroidetes bacterium]